MDSPDDLVKLLRTDVRAWNRQRPRGERLDLSGAVLKGCDLRQARLGGVRLTGADLREANLRECDLTGVTWDGADLRGARLGGAELKRASLRGARLDGAELIGADLEQADLEDASLTDADLRAARLRQVKLGGATLRGARIDAAFQDVARRRGLEVDGVRWESHLEKDVDAEDRPANWTHELLKRSPAQILLDRSRPRATSNQTTLACYAGIVLSLAVALLTYFGLRDANLTVLVIPAMIAMIFVALIPQIAYAFPLAVIPWASLVLTLVGGFLAGAGFALLELFFPGAITVQTLAGLAATLLWTPLLGRLALLRGRVEWSALLLMGAATITVWLGSSLLGSPPAIPFLAEQGVFAPLPDRSDLHPWLWGLAQRWLAVLFMVFTMGFCARHVVEDWLRIQRRVRVGMPRPLVWGAAAVIASVIPMLIFLIIASLGRSSSRARADRAMGVEPD